MSTKEEILLDEDDLVDVLKEVNDVAAHWKGLGLELGLRPSTLETIGTTQPQYYLMNTLTAWLRQNDNVKKYGLPSWTTLCKAVESPVGGNNRALAVRIAKKHNIKDDKYSEERLTKKHRKRTISAIRKVAECQEKSETLHEKTGITPMEVKKGGSLGQGTAVNGEFDLDLVIITEGIAITSVPEARLEGYLLNTLPDRCTNMRVTKMAVIFQYENEIEVKDLIRKAKMWRNAIYCDTHRARPKSYLMALLVIAAHRQAGSEEASAVTKELKKLVENNQSIDVHWDEYYSIGYSGTGITLPPHCAAAPRILDPANPFYNVYHEGFSYSQNPCSEWEKVAGNIVTLDLEKQDGMRIGPNRKAYEMFHSRVRHVMTLVTEINKDISKSIMSCDHISTLLTCNSMVTQEI
eukprot:Em0002g496a